MTRIPVGVALLNPSDFILQCRICGQQWGSVIAPGGAVGYKRKLCPHGCTQRLRALLDTIKSIGLTARVRENSLQINSTADDSFPLTHAGMEAASKWIDSKIPWAGTLENFLLSPDFKAGVIAATRASWTDGGRSVELFRSGDWNIVDDADIDERFIEESGLLLELPTLDTDEMEEFTEKGGTEDDFLSMEFEMEKDSLTDRLREELADLF